MAAYYLAAGIVEPIQNVYKKGNVTYHNFPVYHRCLETVLIIRSNMSQWLYQHYGFECNE
jgi:hypothetical protein